MKRYKFALLCGALLLSLAACGCSVFNKLKARDHLNKGVNAYRNAQFQPAIMHFKEAVRLDPTLLNARLYLATAYAQQYIPGGDSEDNKQVAQQAIDAFQDVLKMDGGKTSASTTALASIAQLYYSMKEFDEAKEYNRRRIKLEPNNPEPYYWIGVLDWGICFPRAQTLRVQHNLAAAKDQAHPNDLPVIPEKLRTGLAEENGPLVEEGLDALKKAVELKPNDADSMVYLNLLYRQKAEIDPDNETREADLKQAEDWVDKALAARKAGTASGSSETAPASAAQ
jgi:tetratricopeptide (TPR) repeat protein